MNNLVQLGLIYGLITIGSAATLYFSFRGRIDESARYFLSAELLMILSTSGVAWANIDPANANPVTFYLTNIFVLLAEASIYLSIKSLEHPVKFRNFVFWTIFILSYCGFIEYSRVAIGTTLPIAIHAFLSAILAWITYFACKTSADTTLKQNLFFRWFGYLEITVLIFAIIRFVSFFTSSAIAPRNPTVATSIFYAVFLTLSVFRYVTYQSLRMSWIDPKNIKANLLNRNLVSIVNERDQLLKGLLDSNRMIGVGALAASLSHELSQPLTGMALQTETIKRNLVESGQDQESVNLVNKVNEQLLKLSNLVKNLRQLFGSNTNKFSSINLTQTIGAILEILDVNLKSRNIQLKEYYYANPTIYGDAIQLQQVLINILNNAVDAIDFSNPVRREILITVDTDSKNAVITIEDSGEGIAPDLLPSIFDLYKTTKKDGLGVGLWLSKIILDKHQASITAFNGNNGGAVFTIDLPLSRD